MCCFLERQANDRDGLFRSVLERSGPSLSFQKTKKTAPLAKRRFKGERYEETFIDTSLPKNGGKRQDGDRLDQGAAVYPVDECILRQIPKTELK